MDLPSGEPLDHPHRSTTLRAGVKAGRVCGAGVVLLSLWLGPCAQQLKAKRENRGAPPIGEKAEMPDAYETFWEQVQKKAFQELIDGKRLQLLFVVVGGIAPAKGDLAISEADQAVIGDGHAVGIAAEILQHVFRAAKRALQIDHPVLSVEWPQPSREDLGLGEERQVCLEAEQAVLKGLLKRIHELATKEFR
ncbi:MAG TPA: hypothetical protein VFJ47_16975 [Terriglobales bacterium]|nr:hypothetical protein [Terriglobales bacterium]